MIAVVQRVSSASVVVESRTIGNIDAGFLVLLCVVKGDDEKEAVALARKIIGLRVFNDEAGRFNLDLKGVSGSLLVVSQFTLAADIRKGKIPSFTGAAPPEEAKQLYSFFVDQCRRCGLKVETGSFAASMEVRLVNDGPVTIIINTDDLNVK